ncbi:MAG TPA: prepilin-type N-terminal cleavage/methylation domain-containing protein [Patescibacteria group bacterium]|nr:prepilin-type N-terminal cleavage/methylation domain-containing protein [Patescibacteria group bacterium]
MKKNFNNKESFTLIELMVSLSILVLVILAAMAIYLRVIGTRSKTLGQLNIQEDGQFLMTLISKDIRSSQIDYDNYGNDCDAIEGASTAINNLCLKRISSGEEIVYKKGTTNEGIDVLERCQAPDCDSNDDSDFKAITMTQINVSRLNFYIRPASDPFEAGSVDYVHPRATIVLRLESLVEKDPPSPLLLQQTVPQRYGFRR